MGRNGLGPMEECRLAAALLIREAGKSLRVVAFRALDWLDRWSSRAR